MTDHAPECPYSKPCPDEWRNAETIRKEGLPVPHRIVSGSSGRCIECGAGDCICDELMQARDRGYGEAMDDGWGEPGHIDKAVRDERERIGAEVDGVCVGHYSADPCTCVIRITTVKSIVNPSDT